MHIQIRFYTVQTYLQSLRVSFLKNSDNKKLEYINIRVFCCFLYMSHVMKNPVYVIFAEYKGKNTIVAHLPK